MPPEGFSWREERDWDVHNASEWLLSGPPAQISSETLNGCKATKKKLVRTMALQTRNFAPSLPARLPPEVAARLAPIMNSLVSRHFGGQQSEPLPGLAEWGLDSDDEDEEMRRTVMISSLTLPALDGDKLHVLFFRQTTSCQCLCGAVIFEVSLYSLLVLSNPSPITTHTKPHAQKLARWSCAPSSSLRSRIKVPQRSPRETLQDGRPREAARRRGKSQTRSARPKRVRRSRC